MLYLSGGIRRSFDDVLPLTVGWMLQPFKGNRPTPNRWYGADNGCFAAPEKYDEEHYLRWLAGLEHQHKCLFATAPDVVGDAEATLQRSRLMLDKIQRIGLPAALVAQDGLESLTVPWETFDCLFIGGTTDWKLGEAAHDLMRQAKDRGKHVHMGRVNSLRRLRLAQLAGCDSADGTFLAFGPDVNLPRMESWLREIERQPPLWKGIA